MNNIKRLVYTEPFNATRHTRATTKDMMDISEIIDIRIVFTLIVNSVRNNVVNETVYYIKEY